MKKVKLVSLCLIIFLCCCFSATAQEEDEKEVLNVTATYTGIEDGTFVFSYTDQDGEESTISFNKILPEIKKLYDLTKKEMIGQKFAIMYSNVNEEEKDANGEVDYVSVKTILMLKKV
ncbi:hypothetical protein [Kordia sp.]|uniref:hypothetical protein n=1 Tax=Kordia sp. TaxID=1965332 RepID=UPI003D2CF35F